MGSASPENGIGLVRGFDCAMPKPGTSTAAPVRAIDPISSRRVNGIVSHLGTREPMDNGAGPSLTAKGVPSQKSREHHGRSLLDRSSELIRPLNGRQRTFTIAKHMSAFDPFRHRAATTQVLFQTSHSQVGKW